MSWIPDRACALQSPSPREQAVIRECHELDGCDARTLEEIAVDRGVTRERIRQIQFSALKKLRRRLEQTESAPLHRSPLAGLKQLLLALAA